MKPQTQKLSRSQVALVLERAARLEHDGDEEGLTIAELQSVAQEVGIPSNALSRALADLASTSSEERPSTWKLTRHVDTGTVSRIPDDDLAWLLRILAQLGQIKGHVRYEGGVLRWSTPDGFEMELRSHPAGTDIRVQFDDIKHLTVRTGLFALAGGAWTTVLFYLMETSYPEIVLPAIAGSALGAVGSLAYWRARATAVGERLRKRTAALIEVLKMVKSRPDSPEE